MKILFFLPLFFSSLSAKTYDCFLFFNEIEILKIRMAELNDVVDYYVLVESHETFKGNPKPLFFEKNKSLFAPYLDKIIHVVVEKHPEFKRAWDRERYQRNAIVRGLKNLDPSDIVLISDCDEIPRAELVEQLGKYFQENKGDQYTFLMNMYAYKLNLFWNDHWHGTTACRYSTLLKTKPDKLRSFRNEEKRVHLISQGGWHFTSIGTKEAIEYKFNAYSHDYSADERISTWLREFPIMEIDDTFPTYIREHLDHFKEIDYVFPY